MSGKFYKALNTDGTPCNGGAGPAWFLPTGNRPGKWMPPIKGELVACENGYHLCRLKDMPRWLGPAIYEAEYRGDSIKGGGKVVVRQARLISRTAWDETGAQLFAADCAEHVLHLFEKNCPGDDRPRKAIEAARVFARGKMPQEVLAAARTAAEAAGAAAWAAWAAARAAARDAARAAARDAARTAARAAGDAAWAARDAARAAAWAAWDAGAAARDAAGAAGAAAGAAGAAAGAAERKWHIRRLKRYL